MQIEQTIYDYYAEKHGNELKTRFLKLREEFDELIESFDIYGMETDPADRDIKRAHLLDEMCDVASILSHINSILGTDFEELLINALIKNKVRETIKDYKH